MSGNSMRWNCRERGCFNVKKRPKTEVFHECFDRGVNFGDVDHIVETHGQFLFFEWKPSRSDLPTGQRRLHEALLRLPQFTVIIVIGDAESMIVDSFVIRHLREYEEVHGDLASLKARVHMWWLDSESI